MTDQEKRIIEGARLQEFINSLNINGNKFSKQIGVSQPLISQVINGVRQFTRELGKKIASRYPNFNEAWIYTGKGQMLLEDSMVNSNQFTEGEPRTLQDLEKDNKADPLFHLKEMLEDYGKRIAALEERQAAMEREAKVGYGSGS